MPNKKPRPMPGMKAGLNIVNLCPESALRSKVSAKPPFKAELLNNIKLEATPARVCRSALGTLSAIDLNMVADASHE
jgi:hypothetical protein